MKKNISIAVLALLLSSEVSAVRIRDIFDAYDEESKKELLQTDDNIDPATLTAEIAGDQIAKDVKSATAGVADNAMVQLSDEDLVYDQVSGTFELAQKKAKSVDDSAPKDSKKQDVKEGAEKTDKAKDKEESKEAPKSKEAQLSVPEDPSGTHARLVAGGSLSTRVPAKEDLTRQGLFGGDATDLWNSRHGEIPGPGADKVNQHPEPGLERNDKSKEENDKQAKLDKAAAMKDERENGGLMNIKNEGKLAKAADAIPSLSAADKETEELKSLAEKKKSSLAQALGLEDMGDFNIDDIPARSESEYDGEYVQLRLAEYVDRIEGPGDLESITLADDDLSQLKWERGNNEIVDADGDGVEDNISDGWDSWKFDQFYDPAAFHVVEDINNTHHGNLPGMKQKEFEDEQTEPLDTYTIVEDHDWVRW